MRIAAAASLLLLLLAQCVRQADGNEGIGISGCPCVGSCERTVDSPFNPWCYTSERGVEGPQSNNNNNNNADTNTSQLSPSPSPSAPPRYCGWYSIRRSAYWSPCNIVNATSGQTPSVELETFSEIWVYITISCVSLTATAYVLFGCAAGLRTSPRTTLWWLPWTAGFVGICNGLIVAAPFAAIVSFLYLSIPYAIDSRVAVSMGLGLAILLVYSGFGRQHRKVTPLHASEYGS